MKTISSTSTTTSSDQDDRLVARGLGLLRHCYTEFSFLSRLLPSLYYGERANGEAVPLPW